MDRFKYRAWDGKEMEYDIAVGHHSLDSNDISETVVILDDGDCWYPHEPYLKVMQCTGLKDWHGKLIFEGDLVLLQINGEEIPEWDIFEVRWMGGHYDIHCECNIDENPLTEPLEDCAMDCEIIGNRFENPELLEAKP